MRLYNRGEMEEALRRFDQALQGLEDGSHPYHALARFYRAESQARLGARLLRDGQDEPALRFLDAALQEQPGYPDLHFRKAVAQFRLGHRDPAEASARQALEINSDLAEARVLLSVILRERGEDDAADEELERARLCGRRRPTALTRFLDAKGGPLSAEQLWEHLFDEESLRRKIDRAEALYHAGDLDESQRRFEELLANYPDFPDLRLKLALILFRKGEQEESLIHLERALSIHPDFGDALVLSAAVLLHQGEVERARRRYEEARKGAALPSPFADYGLAVCRHLTGDEEGCYELIRPLLSQGEVPWEVLALLGATRAVTGQHELARAAYSELEAHGPSPEAWLDAVSFHLQTGDLSAAEHALSQLEEVSGDPEVILARSELLVRQKRDEDAVGLLEEYTREHGLHPALSVAETRLLRRRGELSRGLRRLDEVLQRWPECTPARRERLRILADDERVAEALDELARLGSHHGGAVDDELMRLHLLRRAGRVEEAEELAHRLVKMYPLTLRVRVQQRERWLTPLSVEPLSALGAMEEASSAS